MRVLDGFNVVNVALNLPGPLCCERLTGLGAQVTKVEPPAGDPMTTYDPALYARMRAGQEVRVLDLKTPTDAEVLRSLLDRADLLVTSQRPSARARLGLDVDTLRERHPRLCGVHIVGSTRQPEEPGHDLTYQAALDLLNPPHMPRMLLADIAGAELAARKAVEALFARERGLGTTHVNVGLEDAAEAFTVSWRHGLTRPGALLGGGFSGYAIHRTADGWIAVGALEPHFQHRLAQVLGVALEADEAVRARFRRDTTAHWLALAAERDLPITALPGA